MKAMKKVLRAKKRIDWYNNPDRTNEYLVEAKQHDLARRLTAS